MGLSTTERLDLLEERIRDLENQLEGSGSKLDNDTGVTDVDYEETSNLKANDVVNVENISSKPIKFIDANGNEFVLGVGKTQQVTAGVSKEMKELETEGTITITDVSI